MEGLDDLKFLEARKLELKISNFIKYKKLLFLRCGMSVERKSKYTVEHGLFGEAMVYLHCRSIMRVFHII